MYSDQELVAQLRLALNALQAPECLEKRMFGGVGLLLHGNMLGGVHKGRFIFRVGPDRYAQALRQPGAAPFDITGRAMTGWVMVAAEQCQQAQVIESWAQQALTFCRTLPPK
jgi:TfoX/Sxy family transcriptional regulator of competence genes